LHYKKKKRRVQATNYLIKENDKYIQRYPETDLVKILKDSGYHSEEWKEMDPEEDWPIVQPTVIEDGVIIEEAVKKKHHHYVFMKDSGVLLQYLLF
jgi:hypothetical protein